MKVLNCADLIKMFEGGYKYLKQNKAIIDSLNVFPVPDGDTGTNMTLTMSSAINKVQNAQQDDLRDVLNSYSSGALQGARGNSGVILSQILKGLSVVFDQEATINTKVFSKALLNARDIAYKAVSKPKEGTVLSVIRYMAEQSAQIANKNKEIEAFLEAVIAKGEEMLNKTPEMLPVLKSAGVVDAGGKGLICVFQGYLKALRGEEIEEVAEDAQYEQPSLDAFGAPDNDIEDIENIKFAYCTEFFVINLKKHVTEEDVAKLRDKLMLIGDCVIAIGDISFIKVHVHTNQPNKALGYALQLGELGKVKIENMLEQNRELQAKRAKNRKPIGMIASCQGEGMANIFKDLGVEEIVDGGQSQNPSVDDFVKAINHLNADSAIILPNNGNIILAATEAAKLVNKPCVVIPTKEIPQGISAALMFDVSQDCETNETTMNEAINNVKCGQVTTAVRDTEMDGFEIKVGDYIGLDGKKIVAKADNLTDIVKQVISQLVDDFSSVVTLYHGKDVTPEDANALVEELQSIYDECDVILYEGGQPNYQYLISVE